MRAWDAADLQARLARALDIACKTVDTFAVGGYADAAQSDLSFGPEKPVAEAAMLLYAAAACRERPAIRARWHALGEKLAQHARTHKVQLDIALQPALAFKLGLPHVLLSRLGWRDAGFDALLAHAAASPLRDGHDRPPSACMERAWIRRLWSSGTPGATAPPPPRHARGSVLAVPLDILGGRREDVYAFTHLLFYATDFGHQASCLPRSRSWVLGQAQALLARFLDEEDYDLAAELLLAWPLTGARWSATAAFALRVLAGVEDEAGILPCGNVDLERLAQLQGPERARYALATSYHTALVMGLLCACTLRAPHAPPAQVSGRRFSGSLLDALRPHLSADQGHWQQHFEALAPAEQQVLWPLLLDIAIVQKARHSDYAALAALLALAHRAGYGSAPLVTQGLERMQRLAACARLIAKRRHPGSPPPRRDRGLGRASRVARIARPRAPPAANPHPHTPEERLR